MGRGVSFLDMDKEGHALGVAYLITKEQFEDVARKENGNNGPDGKIGWYRDIIHLGKMDGFEMLTVAVMSTTTIITQPRNIWMFCVEESWKTGLTCQMRR